MRIIRLRGDHDRISVFDQQGEYLYEIGKFGTGDGEFSRPQSMPGTIRLQVLKF